MNRPTCRRDKRTSIPFVVLLAGTFLGEGFAQEKPDFAGDYTANLGPARVALHVTVSPDGMSVRMSIVRSKGFLGCPARIF
jgi:hypothetical protein